MTSSDSPPNPAAIAGLAAPRRRARRSDATANRTALLAAAQSMLSVDPHASLDAIAQAAGLSRRALYGHFADREGLLREVIAIGAQRFNAIAADVDDADPRVAMARMASRLWREASAVRASANIALDDAHVRQTLLALAPLRRRVRDLTVEGVSSGVFRGDMSPQLLAFLVEETARATLRELRVGSADGAVTVVRVVLSIVGVHWTDQAALLDAHPEIVTGV